MDLDVNHQKICEDDHEDRDMNENDSDWQPPKNDQQFAPSPSDKRPKKSKGNVKAQAKRYAERNPEGAARKEQRKKDFFERRAAHQRRQQAAGVDAATVT